MGSAPKYNFSWDSQVRYPQNLETNFFVSLEAHNFLQTFDWDGVERKIVALIESFPKICSMPPGRMYFKDFKLLMVGSQSDTLTLDPSFDHNLCYKYSISHVSPF